MAKKTAVLGILTALCLVLGYIESLVPLNFIAPGIKLGLSNSAVLLLLYSGKLREAISVNLARILLSALLFGSASALAFSLSGAAVSMLIMLLLKRIKSVSIIGASIAGGAAHNLMQGAVAIFLTGSAVIYYFPILLIAGALSGTVIGLAAAAFEKRISQLF